MTCHYDEGHVAGVKCDDVCAGWEPSDDVREGDFKAPPEESVAKEYRMTVKAVVKGPEHLMRYASAVGDMINSVFDEIVDDADMHDGYEIFLLKASEVMVSDKEAGGDA